MFRRALIPFTWLDFKFANFPCGVFNNQLTTNAKVVLILFTAALNIQVIVTRIDILVDKRFFTLVTNY